MTKNLPVLYALEKCELRHAIMGQDCVKLSWELTDARCLIVLNEQPDSAEQKTAMMELIFYDL